MHLMNNVQLKRYFLSGSGEVVNVKDQWKDAYRMLRAALRVIRGEEPRNDFDQWVYKQIHKQVDSGTAYAGEISPVTLLGWEGIPFHGRFLAAAMLLRRE